jgi:hypothetical protein
MSVTPGRGFGSISNSSTHSFTKEVALMRSLAGSLGIVAVSLALSLSASRDAAAQDPKGSGKSDAPSPVHKHLNVFVGSWDVATKFKMGEKESEGRAKCEAKWILDGRFVQQDYQSKLQGQPFSVLQILGYDNEKKKSVEIMMDSMKTGVLHNEGTISDDGKVIRNEGETVDSKTGKPIRIRTVTTILDNDHFTLEWFFPGDDGAYERMVLLTHTRRKSQ